jgi:hypothetical protein
MLSQTGWSWREGEAVVTVSMQRAEETEGILRELQELQVQVVAALEGAEGQPAPGEPQEGIAMLGLSDWEAMVHPFTAAVEGVGTMVEGERIMPVGVEAPVTPLVLIYLPGQG